MVGSHTQDSQVSSQGGSSDDEYTDSDDTTTGQFWPRFTDNKLSAISPVRLKRELELKRKLHQTAWFFRRVCYFSRF
jgi:hypothetical protein